MGGSLVPVLSGIARHREVSGVAPDGGPWRRTGEAALIGRGNGILYILPDMQVRRKISSPDPHDPLRMRVPDTGTILEYEIDMANRNAQTTRYEFAHPDDFDVTQALTEYRTIPALTTSDYVTIEKALARTWLFDTFTPIPELFYSVRKVSTAHTVCLRLRNTTTGVETDIGFDSLGIIDIAACLAACPGTEEGVVVTWYNAGSDGAVCDLTAPAAGNRPYLITNLAPNGRYFTKGGIPCICGMVYGTCTRARLVTTGRTYVAGKSKYGVSYAAQIILKPGYVPDGGSCAFDIFQFGENANKGKGSATVVQYDVATAILLGLTALEKNFNYDNSFKTVTGTKSDTFVTDESGGYVSGALWEQAIGQPYVSCENGALTVYPNTTATGLTNVQGSTTSVFDNIPGSIAQNPKCIVLLQEIGVWDVSAATMTEQHMHDYSVDANRRLGGPTRTKYIGDQNVLNPEENWEDGSIVLDEGGELAYREEYADNP